MKIKNYLGGGVFALCIAFLMSCVDNNMDLSNIDTTARFQTKQLVVPINIDDVTLEQVLDLDDGSDIVKTLNQDNKPIYAMRRTGNFTSEDVIVNDFSIPIPAMDPAELTLELEDLRKIVDFVKIEGNPIAYYEINDYNSIEVPFKSPDIYIDKSIKQIDYIGVTTRFAIKIKVDGLSREALNNTKLTGLKIQFPKGMHISSDKGLFHSETGLLDLSNETIQLNNQGELDMSVNVDGITCDNEHVNVNYDNHHINYAGSIKIKEGKVSIFVDTNLENNIKLRADYFLDAIKVHSFTGKLEYRLEDLSMNPIHIENLPDILSKSGTKIGLENPQIYLSLNNSLYEYNMLFQTDLQLTAMLNQLSKTYGLDDGTFKTQSSKANDNEFLLSPEKPEFFYEGYTDPQYVRFTALRHVLSDLDGIPSMIKIDALEPTLFSGSQSKNFRLGENYGPIVGEYAFFAPLQMTEESQIMYTDTIDGWNDEDVDAITIENLMVAFDASTDVPFDTELTIRPIDTSGNVISGVECTKAILPAEAKDHHIEVTVNGMVTHLDGILIDARLVNRNNNRTLAPEMKLYLKNCKATVTGYYEKEL